MDFKEYMAALRVEHLRRRLLRLNLNLHISMVAFSRWNRSVKPVSDYRLGLRLDWILTKAKFTKLEIGFLSSDWLNSNPILISIFSLIQGLNICEPSGKMTCP